MSKTNPSSPSLPFPVRARVRAANFGNFRGQNAHVTANIREHSGAPPLRSGRALAQWRGGQCS